jgi:hypothetical protein
MHFRLPHQLKIEVSLTLWTHCFQYIMGERPIRNMLGKAKYLLSPFSASKLKHPSFYCAILGKQKCERGQ